MLAALFALLATAGGATGAAPPAPASTSVPAATELASLLTDHVAYAAPDRTSKRLTTVVSYRPITGKPTVLPVIERRAREGEGLWLHVRLPGRPNGRTGWISAQDTTSSSTPWTIVVAIDRRLVVVYRDGHPYKRFSAIVGKPSTPTPRGTFFVEERVPLGHREDGAPFALATSARSNALEHYEGGIGQVALHGTGNLAGTLGTAVSHGCVRLGAGGISWLRQNIQAGVPIVLRAR